MTEKLVVYSDPVRFWEEVSPFLLKDQAKNNLILGRAHAFLSDPGDCVYQSAIFKNGFLAGALIVSKYLTNNNFLPSPISDPDSARKLYEEFAKTKTSVSGIVGARATADLYKIFFEQMGLKAKTNMIQGIYRCTKVSVPEHDGDVIFRVANESDTERIGRWIIDFHEEAVPHDPPIDGMEVARSKVANKLVYVLANGDQVVSMAMWGRDIGTSCSISLVFTPKPLRGKGYGSLVTAKLTDHLLRGGRREVNLYTDMTNPTSNKIYLNVGYEFICDSIHYALRAD